MKVISRTLPALAMGAGLVAMPVMGTARATPMTRDVHLVTLIQTLSHTPAAVRYAVSVRPVGGPAHAATLVLSTRKPAAWTASVPECLANRDKTALACDLGELRESESRTLRVTGRPGVVPVVAQAGAANAPSVTSSLGVMRSQALRLARRADDPPPGQGSPDQDGDPSQSPEAQVSPGESPPAESPPAESPPAESPAAEAAPAEPAESAPAQPPEIVSPAIRPRGTGPQGRVPVAPPRPRGAGPAHPARPAHPAAPHKAPAAPPAAPAPVAVPAPAPVPGIPDTPIIPHMPDVPAGPASAGPIAGPAVPPPGASPPAALPQIAPKTSGGEGISELNTLSPAGAMQAGRTSWATLIAVAVVAEAGLLWLVAGLTVWRRRREGKRVPRALVRARGRSPRPLQGRVLP